MKIYVDGTIIFVDCSLYDPFPQRCKMKPEDEPQEDPQDNESSDNDDTGRPGTV